jgi:iron-sulfur cluster insertion protein
MEIQTDSGHSHTPPVEGGSGVLLSLTEKAIQKVQAFAVGNKEAEGKHLRIYVQGGGCSGFQYGFTFDEKRDDDQVIGCGPVQVLLDPISLPYVQRATVDYVEDFRGSGFVVQNPNATGSCGCGHSFSV